MLDEPEERLPELQPLELERELDRDELPLLNPLELRLELELELRLLKGRARVGSGSAIMANPKTAITNKFLNFIIDYIHCLLSTYSLYEVLL